MHFALSNHSEGRELSQPIVLQYSVLATWWKYREPSVNIHYYFLHLARNRSTSQASFLELTLKIAQAKKK